MFDPSKDEEVRRSKEAEFVKRAVYLEGLRTDEELFLDIWPLQFIDLRDEEQIGVLFRLLRFVFVSPSKGGLTHANCKIIKETPTRCRVLSGRVYLSGHNAPSRFAIVFCSLC